MRLSAAVLLVAVGCGDSSEPEPLAASIDVMTVNLRHDCDEWERRFPLIADEIVRLDPDLIGMQEIEITGVDQTRALLDLITERGGAAYQAYEELKWPPYGTLSGEGVGILSRFPIVETGVRDLLEGGRVVVWTRVELEAGYTVDFYNTHLESGGGNDMMTGD